MEKKFINLVLTVWITILTAASCNRNNEPIPPEDITGVYTCQESSAHSGTRRYFVEIDKVEKADDLFIISNFHNMGDTEFLYAELNQDTLRIINQVLAEFRINGKGAVEDDFRSISLYYEMDDGLTVLDYYASFTR